jgi:hypothetical protein
MFTCLCSDTPRSGFLRYNGQLQLGAECKRILSLDYTPAAHLNSIGTLGIEVSKRFNRWPAICDIVVLILDDGLARVVGLQTG